MLMPRPFATTTAVAVGLLVTAACTSGSSGGGASGAGAPTTGASGAVATNTGAVKPGGTMTVALAEDPDKLDPTLGRSLVGREVFANFCEKLYDVNDKLEVVPQLAAAAQDLGRRQVGHHQPAPRSEVQRRHPAGRRGGEDHAGP